MLCLANTNEGYVNHVIFFLRLTVVKLTGSILKSPEQ